MRSLAIGIATAAGGGLGTLGAAPSPAGASGYGQLIARHDAAPSTSLQTSFETARPPATFLLVVTQPREVPLKLTWSLHCAGSGAHEHGGAKGTALVASGRWVKRVRADWIPHPRSCAGGVSGTAGAGPVLVRVFVD